MATYVKTAVLSAPLDEVWEAIADVGNVPRLTAMVVASRMEGDTRYCTFAGGGELRETILSVDHERRRMAYRVHRSPFPIDEHAASMVVTAEGDGARVTWTTDLKPDDALPVFAEAADAMFADLVSRLGT
ncbi:MAG: SRPBCC family protein [Myxococcota bacterium]